YGGGLDDGDIRLGGWGDRYEGLMSFDTSILPEDVTGVTLHLYNDTPDGKQATGFDIHTASGTWDENTKWASRPGQGDLVTTVSAPPADGWIEIDLSDYLAQADGGFVLTPHSNANRFTYLTSTEGEEEFRPYLELTYADEFML
ncbi:MAG: DNRLRE domain-containing protein, partial [Pseudomonadota bacterium]